MVFFCGPHFFLKFELIAKFFIRLFCSMDADGAQRPSTLHLWRENGCAGILSGHNVGLASQVVPTTSDSPLTNTPVFKIKPSRFPSKRVYFDSQAVPYFLKRKHHVATTFFQACVKMMSCLYLLAGSHPHPPLCCRALNQQPIGVPSGVFFPC